MIMQNRKEQNQKQRHKNTKNYCVLRICAAEIRNESGLTNQNEHNIMSAGEGKIRTEQT